MKFRVVWDSVIIQFIWNNWDSMNIARPYHEHLHNKDARKNGLAILAGIKKVLEEVWRDFLKEVPPRA